MVKRMDKKLIGNMMLLAGALALAGCGSAELEKESSKKKSRYSSKAKPVLVELAKVTRGPIEKILERSAPLEAEAQVEVHARTSNPAVDLLVEEGDADGLAAAALDLISDPQRYREFSRAARAAVDEEFALPRTIERLEGHYHEAIQLVAEKGK